VGRRLLIFPLVNMAEIDDHTLDEASEAQPAPSDTRTPLLLAFVIAVLAALIGSSRLLRGLHHADDEPAAPPRDGDCVWRTRRCHPRSCTLDEVVAGEIHAVQRTP